MTRCCEFVFILAFLFQGILALSQSIRSHQFGVSGLFPAPKLTDMCLTRGMSTWWVNTSEAELGLPTGHFEAATGVLFLLWSSYAEAKLANRDSHQKLNRPLGSAPREVG